MKKFLYTIISASLVSVIFSAHAFAIQNGHEQIILQNAPTSVAQQQQFYIDVALDTQGADINGIQGTLSFSDTNISFVRAETGTSNITLWLDQPKVVGNTMKFSGIIPGGFDGLINPFDQSHKLPGGIVRLVFVGNAAGLATITTSNVSVTLNDGYGTLEHIPDTTTGILVSNQVAPSRYTTTDTIPPTLTASVVTDPNLYDGAYTLIFSATDKESGINHVEVKEGEGDWSTVESPYLLHDQSRKGILSVRAYDTAGNIANVVIAPPVSSKTSAVLIVLLIGMGFLILYVIHKKTSNHPSIE